MPLNTYRAIPLEPLYELCGVSVKDMLIAHDSNLDNRIAFKSHKKQGEIIPAEIEEKKKEQRKLMEN